MPCSGRQICGPGRQVVFCKGGLPSDASGSHVSPSAAAVPPYLLPLGSGPLSGSQGHTCRGGNHGGTWFSTAWLPPQSSWVHTLADSDASSPVRKMRMSPGKSCWCKLTAASTAAVT